MSRYELLDEIDLPFPLGGCFGYWGYDLKNYVEPKLARRAVNDLELPDCSVGFYDSLVVFDHRLAKTWIVSTGLDVEGSRSEEKAHRQLGYWITKLRQARKVPDVLESITAIQLFGTTDPLDREGEPASSPPTRREWTVAPSPIPWRIRLPGEVGHVSSGARPRHQSESSLPTKWDCHTRPIVSTFSRSDFIDAVECARRYIRAGDIYQVNLSQRLAGPCSLTGWDFFQRLTAVSPAPFAAFLDCGDVVIASSSPERFLRVHDGRQVETRPIKGTRPRGVGPEHDAALALALAESDKDRAENVMIVDLLRNDLSRVCRPGTVRVPELFAIEHYATVHHMVSTVVGELAPEHDGVDLLRAAFPGGSITGAPKVRAMQIIAELEPTARGAYCGAIGYVSVTGALDTNIVIRTYLVLGRDVYFQVGAGIVADSDPEQEYRETLDKARGLVAALTP